MSQPDWMPAPAILPGWERPICWHSIADLVTYFASEICIYPVRGSRPPWEESRLQSLYGAFFCCSEPLCFSIRNRALFASIFLPLSRDHLQGIWAVPLLPFRQYSSFLSLLQFLSLPFSLNWYDRVHGDCIYITPGPALQHAPGWKAASFLPSAACELRTCLIYLVLCNVRPPLGNICTVLPEQAEAVHRDGSHSTVGQ